MISHLPSLNKKSQRRPRTFKRLTITLAADSKMPVIAGQWRRLPNGLIRAWYTPNEYAKCLDVFQQTRSNQVLESEAQPRAE